MLIELPDVPRQAAYDAPAGSTRQAIRTGVSADPPQPALSSNVTLSDAARQLLNQRHAPDLSLDKLAAPPANATAKKSKKRRPSPLPLFDVDAMRTIRDKLRAQSLNIREPGLQEKKLRDQQQEENNISV